MLTSLFHAGSFNVWAVLMTLAASLLLGLVIALVFCLASGRREPFGAVLSCLPVLVSSVILIVNGNLGASVAVLGAFGLVRFRSAPGTAREITYIFFAMAVGLAAGMGFLTLASLMTGVTGAALFILEKTGIFDGAGGEQELKVTIPEDLDYSGIFDDLFIRYTKDSRLMRVRTTNMGTMYELTYRLRLRRERDGKALIDDVRCRNGNLTVILGCPVRERNEW